MTNPVIEHLNKILKNELTAINQYFLHAKIADHQGFAIIAKKFKDESIDEMIHADEIIKRILFLGGIPNLQDLGKLLIGETIEEMLNCDLKIEDAAIRDLRVAISVADESGDVVTANLLEDILKSEESHQDWLRKQISIIGNIGIENYLSTLV